MATSTEFSAGGVVVRDGKCVVIVPTRRAADGSKVLALPKGHPEKGESPADAALREVREEAGVRTTLIEKLGDTRYWYMRDGKRIAKVVAFFLLDYVSDDPARRQVAQVPEEPGGPGDDRLSALAAGEDLRRGHRPGRGQARQGAHPS